MELFALYFNLLFYIELSTGFWIIFDVKNIHFYMDIGKKKILK